jgi:hypothetical protein
MKRTEIIHIPPNPTLNYYCHLSKNLYNQATYLIKQHLKENKLLSYPDLNKLLKDSENYKELPTQSAQQILKIVVMTLQLTIILFDEQVHNFLIILTLEYRILLQTNL